jgi:hypothetical protein
VAAGSSAVTTPSSSARLSKIVIEANRPGAPDHANSDDHLSSVSPQPGRKRLDDSGQVSDDVEFGSPVTGLASVICTPG